LTDRKKRTARIGGPFCFQAHRFVARHAALVSARCRFDYAAG